MTTDNTNLFPGGIIPDGSGGVLATWVDSPNVPAGQPPAQSTFRAARISSRGGVTLFDLPLTPPLQLLVRCCGDNLNAVCRGARRIPGDGTWPRVCSLLGSAVELLDEGVSEGGGAALQEKRVR